MSMHMEALGSSYEGFGEFACSLLSLLGAIFWSELKASPYFWSSFDLMGILLNMYCPY